MNDDTPTPKQSGSYGIMQDACETSIKSLETWVEHVHRDDVDQVRALQGRFKVLLDTVLSWPTQPPTQDEKMCTIEDIFAARTEATEWGKARGLKL